MADAKVYTINSSRKEYFKEEYEALQIGTSVSASRKLASLSPVSVSDRLIRYNVRLERVEF